MPRMSDADKQKSHARIIDAAARLFREDGIGATSVSDVMRAAGLTHGGFYRHFTSKEDLVVAAFDKAVDDMIAAMEATETASQRQDVKDDYISRYLSLEHANKAGNGCPLAAMGSEIFKYDGEIKDAASRAIDRTSALLDDPSDQQAPSGLAMIAMLVGTITLARLAKSENGALQIIDAGKSALEQLQKD